MRLNVQVFLYEIFKIKLYLHCRKLKYLGLAYNQLTSVPDGLGSENQYLIDYSHNQLSDMPTVSSNTKQLYFNGNAIKSLRKAIFENAASLTHLYIANNSISSIENGAFEGASKLFWFDAAVSY